MKLSLSIAAAALLAVLLAACAQPLPAEKMQYAGEWRGTATWLVITPQGYCEYRRVRGNGSVEINAPIKHFEGDNFVVGVGPMTTTFVVSKPPRLEEGRWTMTVDGVELVRVSAFGETRT
jgi:hypothetical protein